MLKSYGVGGGGGGPCDFSVSPSPFGLDFGTLDFGPGLDNITGEHYSIGAHLLHISCSF